MSRSYKKHPYYTDGKAKETVKSKRFANKAVRNYKNKIANGNAYKHLFCSYEIHDFINRRTWLETKKDYENPENIYLKSKFPNQKELYRYWSKYFKRK